MYTSGNHRRALLSPLAMSDCMIYPCQAFAQCCGVILLIVEEGEADMQAKSKPSRSEHGINTASEALYIRTIEEQIIVLLRIRIIDPAL